MGEAPGETQTHLCQPGENFGENGKANFLARWRLHRQIFTRARTSEKPEVERKSSLFKKANNMLLLEKNNSNKLTELSEFRQFVCLFVSFRFFTPQILC